MKILDKFYELGEILLALTLVAVFTIAIVVLNNRHDINMATLYNQCLAQGTEVECELIMGY